MSNKKDQQKQALLQQQSAEDRAREQAALTAASAPSPLEKTYETGVQNYLDDTSGANGPVDFTKVRGLGLAAGLYNNASQRQQGERMGIGALQLGAQGQNPELGQLLRQQSSDERQQAASGQFENAVRMKDAQVRGDVLPLLGLDQNRSLGIASLSSGNANNSTNQYANFRPAPSFWQQLLLTGIGGAAQVGAGLAGNPNVHPSDSRLKERIVPLSSIVAKLKRLYGVSFIWNLKAAALGLNPGETDGGVLAQQVATVFPELVSIAPDGYRRVNYTTLTGMLLEAMKILEQENTQLRQQLAA